MDILSVQSRTAYMSGKELGCDGSQVRAVQISPAFSSIDMVDEVGQKVVAVNTERREMIQTMMAFNTKPAEIVWLRFTK
jgi:phosphoribosylformylglycinamidine (FGAM) synthase-like enzyme